jgi:hypothetical protein
MDYFQVFELVSLFYNPLLSNFYRIDGKLTMYLSSDGENVAYLIKTIDHVFLIQCD